jgi:hypothetical protein
MALIKLGPMVGGISGSIAATTFARNRAGWYARARTKPVIPISLRRDAVQQRLTQVVENWHKLLNTNARTAWNNKALQQVFQNKLGEAYVPTSINLFVRSNTKLLESGQSAVTIPPATPLAPVFAPTLAWTTLVGIQITAIGGFSTTPPGRIVWSYTHGLPLAKNFYKGPWEFTGSLDIASLAALPLLLSGSADLDANTRSFFRFAAVRQDGSCSTPIITSCDVGSPA